MIVIELGNKKTTASLNHHGSMTLPTTIKFQVNERVQVGVPASQHQPAILYDFVILLGVKFHEGQFWSNIKFYPFNFSRASNGKIEIIIPSYEGIKYKRMNIETIVALYLHQIIQRLLLKSGLKFDEVLKSHKFYFIISNGSIHPHRYALKQACEIIGIGSPIFVPSSHSSITSYYSRHFLKDQTKSMLHAHRTQKVCLVEIADRCTSIVVYKFQPWQQQIIEVLSMKTLNFGGYHFTKMIGNWLIEKIKQQKGIDIQKNSHYMNILQHESENAKVVLCEPKLNDRTENQLQKQAWIRIPDLPDESTYGKLITQELIGDIFQTKLQEIVQNVEEVRKNQMISQILLKGKSINIPRFIKKVHSEIGDKYGIEIVNLEEAVKDSKFGVNSQKHQINLFQISEFSYKVTGEQNFSMQLLNKDEPIPMRRCEMVTFPSGELEFNLKIFEDGVKVAHFLLESRPKEYKFGLNFQYDRNKLVHLYVTTTKGRITLQAKYEGLALADIENSVKIVSSFD